MADIYDEAKALAAEMLAPVSQGGNGAELTLQRITKGEYDPATGGAADIVQAYEGSGFRETYSQRDIDGTVIKQGDVKILISPVLLDGSETPQPQSQDRVLFVGDQYTVQNVEPWNYAGVAVGFSVQARK
ncbi:hypothetical protein [Pseudomonas typographi]|uniref:hypothetical protein n=1 Tax=Pseudomonas typographi TaxID=2715964 RepID=UPI00168567E2|nr:hypothetical protein [Pseudomonas typographi]MBD1589785.1 hypothetical protein [Pseudomonas typographi]